MERGPLLHEAAEVPDTLGFDEVQAVERQLDLLDASPVIPVGPCSFPMENYIKMLIAVWEHKLAMHVKLGANAAERYFRSVLKLPPVGTSRDLQEAVSQFTRTVGSFVRASDEAERQACAWATSQASLVSAIMYTASLRTTSRLLLPRPLRPVTV